MYIMYKFEVIEKILKKEINYKDVNKEAQKIRKKLFYRLNASVLIKSNNEVNCYINILIKKTSLLQKGEIGCHFTVYRNKNEISSNWEVLEKKKNHIFCLKKIL